MFYVGIQQEYNQLVISWIKFPFAIFMAVLIRFWFLQTAVNESEKDRGQSELDVTGCLPTGNLCNLLGISWQFSPQLLNVKKMKSPVNCWFYLEEVGYSKSHSEDVPDWRNHFKGLFHTAAIIHPQFSLQWLLHHWNVFFLLTKYTNYHYFYLIKSTHFQSTSGPLKSNPVFNLQ